MKHFSFLVIAGLWMCHLVHAQLPDVSHVDYSTRTGIMTDTRDGKTYAYKKYGNAEWFMQNLNYETEDGENIYSLPAPEDPAGEKYGRMYKSNVNVSIMSTWCPDGWRNPTRGDYQALFSSIKEEYGLTDVVNNGTVGEGSSEFDNLAKYLRAGGVQGTDENGLWMPGTEIDPIAAQIGFNALPAGVYDINISSYSTNSNQRTDDRPGYMSSFMHGGYYHYYLTDNTGERNKGDNVVYQGRNSYYYGSIRCIRTYVEDVEIKTPYPEELTIKQIISAEKEASRLKHSFKKYDHALTGFYLPAGKKLVLNVDLIREAADGRIPQVVIGTRGLINEKTQSAQSVKEIDLYAGVNTIPPDMHDGGLIYFRYVSDTDQPQGEIKVRFIEGSEHIRAPHWKEGITSKPEMQNMLRKYDEAVDVMFSSEYAVVAVTLNSAESYITGLDIDRWFEGIHHLIDEEDKISGMDNDDPNPLHHRLRVGEIRYLLTHSAGGSPHATNWYTGYPTSSQPQLLSEKYLWDNGGWGLGHELGHQHQQEAYKIQNSTESTVNIYSHVVARFFAEQRGETDYNRTPAAKWEIAKNTYLSLPVEERDYSMSDDDLDAITGKQIEKNELRFMVWEHMFLLFDDEFYQRLHRIVREEDNTGGSEQQKREYLIWKSSQITGYDLREFFNLWGIRVTDEYTLHRMTQNFEQAIARQEIIPAPYPAEEMINVTGQNKPDWAPLPLRGISSSEPPVNTDKYKMPENPEEAIAQFVDYSSKKGVVQDARDEKQYYYKQYGDVEWFIQNLAYQTADPLLSLTSYMDPEGIYYGYYYKSNESSSTMSSWCPEGWHSPTRAEYDELFNSIITEYGITDVIYNNIGSREGLSEFDKMAKYLKAGGYQSEGGLWEDPWREGINIIDEKAARIGFNVLPAGVLESGSADYLMNSTKGTDDRIGRMGSLMHGGYYHYYMTPTYDDIIYQGRHSNYYGSMRCVRDAVSLIDQGITFDSIPDKIITDEDFELGVVASSGLPLTYISSDEKVATVVNGKVHITGGGKTTITVYQEGDETYSPSLKISRELTVHKQNQTIDFGLLPDRKMGEPDFDPEAVASSGLPITYSSSDRSVAIIINGKIQLVAPGTTTITAMQNGNEYFNAAIPVEQELVVVDGEVPTGIEEVDTPAVSIYPNPVHAGQPVHIGLDGVPDAHKATLQIYNMTGTLVQSQSLAGKENSVRINNRGIYIFKIHSGTFEKRMKVMVK